MSRAILALLAALLLGVDSQPTTTQRQFSSQTPPIGEGPISDSPALVAADPALVSAIVQGVINEVGAVTQQSEEPVHVTPQLVQDIVQKVLLNLAVTLTRQEPGPAIPNNTSSSGFPNFNSAAAAGGSHSFRTAADSSDPANKTDSDRPHFPQDIINDVHKIFHHLRHHGNDSDTDSKAQPSAAAAPGGSSFFGTAADSNSPINKTTDSDRPYFPQAILDDINRAFRHLHQNNNDSTAADSDTPANKTDSDRPHFVQSVINDVHNAFHHLHHHQNNTDADSTAADAANPANKTDSGRGPNFPQSVIDALKKAWHHGDNSTRHPTAADSANPANETENSHRPNFPHRVINSLRNAFHRHHHHHHHDDNDNNTSTVPTASGKSSSSNNNTFATASNNNNVLNNNKPFNIANQRSNSIGPLGPTNNNYYNNNNTVAAGRIINNPNPQNNNNNNPFGIANNGRNGLGALGTTNNNTSNTNTNTFGTTSSRFNNNFGNAAADSADPANRTGSMHVPHMHDIAQSLGNLLHHPDHNNNNNDNNNNDDDDGTNSANADAANRTVNNGLNLPPPQLLNRGGNNDGSVNQPASRNIVTDSDNNGTVTTGPQGVQYPTLHLGGVDTRPLSKEEICQLPPITGLCRGYMPSYHYNSTSGACDRFIYGGCGGNKNRFKTEQECVTFCAQKQ